MTAKSKTNIKTAAPLPTTAACPKCGATCKVAKVYKDRTSRMQRFECECGNRFGQMWILHWPNRWLRQQEA